MGVGIASAVNYPNNDGGLYYPVFTHVDPARSAYYSFYASSFGSQLVVSGRFEIRCLRGCVQRKCGPAPGFVYLSPAGGPSALYAAASTASLVVGHPPVGARVVYTQVNEQNNNDVWYHIQSPNLGDGWVPAVDVSCTRSWNNWERPLHVDPNYHIVPGTLAYTAAGRG